MMFKATCKTNSRLTALQPYVVAIPFYVGWRTAQPAEGERISRHTGSGLDYCDFRDYRPGDSMRRLNWRMLDRAPDRPTVNVYEAERKVQVTVLVDVGPTMLYGSQELNKLELAAVLTGSVLSSAIKTWESGSAICFNKTGIVGRLPLKGSSLGPALVPAVMDTVLNEGRLPGSSNNGRFPGQSYSTGGGLHHAICQLPTTRSLVFIISDFANFATEQVQSLQRAACQHEVVCLLVNDLRERELPNARLLSWLPLPAVLDLQDANGDHQLMLSTKKNRERFAEAARLKRVALMDAITATGAKCATFTTDEEFNSRRMHMTLLFAGRRQGSGLDQQYPTRSPAEERSNP